MEILERALEKMYMLEIKYKKEGVTFVKSNQKIIGI